MVNINLGDYFVLHVSTSKNGSFGIGVYDGLVYLQNYFEGGDKTNLLCSESDIEEDLTKFKNGIIRFVPKSLEKKVEIPSVELPDGFFDLNSHLSECGFNIIEHKE